MSFNLDEEVIDGHLVTAETKKLWAVEMDLAQKLLEVCKKHDLKVWATGGTLLGAVRHKGFIPWDDDMDFCMMRDDYDNLMRIGPKEFKEPYFFQSIYTDNFGGGLVKIRNSNTTMLARGYKSYKPMNMGCAIDVFVLDAIPNDSKEFAKMYDKLKFKRRLLQNYMLLDPQKLSLYGKLKHIPISLYVKVCNPLNMNEKIDKILTSNNICDNEECGLIDYSAQSGYDVSKITLRSNKHCYDETIELPFCNILIPAPKGYDEILSRHYGDYMTPVKGTAFHSLELVDCDRPYQNVLAEMEG